MNSISESFNSALQEMRFGRLPVAEQIVRQILAVQPEHLDALHLLGFLLTQTARYPEAVQRLRQAIAISPNFAQLHNNLGLALKGLGQLDEAVRCHERALKLSPDDAGNLCNLGNALTARGNSTEAITHYQQGIRLNPNDAMLHSNLGTAFKAAGKLDDAIACYRRALTLKPDDINAHCNLGNALSAQGLLDEAVASYESALRIEPKFYFAQSNLGATLQKQDNFDGAITCYRKALSLKPDHAEALCNLGTALQKQTKLDESIASYRQALRVIPDYAEAKYNLGTAQLQAGDFESGWLNYEDRIKVIPLQTFEQPRWDGSPLDGRRILLLAEQGLGDTLQFIRYARIVKACGGHVIVACQSTLRELLKGVEGIDELVVQPRKDESTLPPFDVYLHLLSTPRVLGTTLETVSNHVPYLSVDEQLVEYWKQELGNSADLKVGIAWQGNSQNPNDRSRSIRLTEFEPIARTLGVSLYSLQKGDGSEQVQSVSGQMKVHDFTSRMDESTGTSGLPTRERLGESEPIVRRASTGCAGPFLDTAALMKNLDLVITSDTSIAHLAGALGIPVWVALSYSPDWRWMLNRDDSPWYPTMRLFRQKTAGDWASVFQRMADELPRFQSARNMHAPSESSSASRTLVMSKNDAAHSIPSASASAVMVETSIGELADKITILEIKSDRIDDPAKLVNVRRELETLRATFSSVIAQDAIETSKSEALNEFVSQLKSVNEALWQIEDDIRDCERAKDFGPTFVELARSVYRQNDRRAALKRQINDLLGSRIVEEKSYRDYEEPSK